MLRAIVFFAAMLSLASAYSTYEVEFETTVGSFTIKVERGLAPLGADRFLELLELPDGGYFKKAGFFRVLPGFVVQFGIAAEPALSEAWRSKSIKDDPVVGSNTVGTIAYAAAGPNTRTTQVFINYGDNSRLDAMGFAPFGRVTSGMDVATKIFSGYAQEPDQNLIYQQGDKYLQDSFPKLDYILSTKVTNKQ